MVTEMGQGSLLISCEACALKRRLFVMRCFHGGDVLDSPLYINAFLGSSKAPTPTEMERSVICAKPKDGANNETDSEATCCPDALSLQGFR